LLNTPSKLVVKAFKSFGIVSNSQSK